MLHIDGFRVEHADKDPTLEDGVSVVKTGTQILLRLYGSGITSHTVITFTRQIYEPGGTCQLTTANLYKVVEGSLTERSALFEINLENDGLFYFCAKNTNLNKTLASFEHQGNSKWLTLRSATPFLPLGVQILIISICLCFSALFSGLNLGLMSLDRTDLKILCNTGSEIEKRYARAIQPVRDHGNFLLCSILLGNVLVNSTFTILLDSLTSGLVAIICSTLLIVIFGEVIPQAICSRHGLAVGARTILITKSVMVLTFPLSYPTSKVLDYLLGEEIGNFYNRERLKELVKVTTDVNDLDKDEVNIISGVLELRKKTVGCIMTHIEDAYMLPIDSILNFETISEIMDSGFSRIPVYENDRKNILTLLYIKDLAFVDTDDSTPLRTLCEFYQNPCHFVFDDLTLDVMFKQFKEGNRGHMAFVHRVNNDGEGDPFYETIGLVTLEDVIEELIQAEIMDETDVFTDNRTKIRRLRPRKQDFSYFIERRNDNQKIRISPQLTLATFQYLSTTLDPFKKDMISETILRRLLNQDIVRHVKIVKAKERNDPNIFIFHQGKAVDFFVLLLEGRVEVKVGKESLVFEGGPFTYFGLQALIQNVGLDSPIQQQPQPQQQQVMGSLNSLNVDSLLRHTFIPDYSVKALTDLVYLKISKSLYLAAKRATLMEQAQRMGEHNNDIIDEEVEKLLHSLDEGEDFNPSAVHTPHSQSMAPSPTSNLLMKEIQQGESQHVTFSTQTNGGNHVVNYVNEQTKAPVEPQDANDADTAEAEQNPLLARTS
ncbi:unnamed protein product [Diamesa tonsa]